MRATSEGRRATLITGGSSGIGLAMSRRFHARGDTLLVVSLSEAELEAMRAELSRPAAPPVHGLVLDLTLPGAGQAAFDEAKRLGLEVDVLVNSAGFGIWGEHVELDPERVRKMVELNTIALTDLCGRAGQRMKQRGRGTILNVASTAGFQPLPRFAAYAASKAYVIAFTHALAEEMAPHGVHVAVLCPGTTRTPFLATAGIGPDGASKSVGSWADRVAMNPDEVARCAIEGLSARRRVIVPGGGNQAHRWLSRLFPDTVAARAWSSLWRGKPH